MMDSVIVTVIGRVVERLLIASGGLLCLWLGYKLFFLAAAATVKSLEVEGHGIKLRAEVIAPGIFFAAFGAGLLGYAAYTKIDVTTAPGKPQNAGQQKHATPDTIPTGDPGTTRIVSNEPGAPDTVPNLVRAANTLLTLRRTQVDGKREELNAGERAEFMKAAQYLTEIQRDFVEKKYGDARLYDAILDIQEHCDQADTACRNYRADPQRRRLMDQVLSDLATGI